MKVVIKLISKPLFFSFFLLQAGSASAMATEKPTQKKFDLYKSFPGHKWWKGYSDFVEHEITQAKYKPLFDIDSNKIQDLCPNYEKLKRSNKQKFWKVFFMSIAYAESDFNHNSSPCAGIMQLTCDSTARKYYGCPLCKSNSTLRKNPLIGIQCAMSIVSHWAKRGKLLNTKHPYFATLRPNIHYRKKVRPSIIKFAPKECKAPNLDMKKLWPVKEKNIEL